MKGINDKVVFVYSLRNLCIKNNVIKLCLLYICIIGSV